MTMRYAEGCRVHRMPCEILVDAPQAMQKRQDVKNIRAPLIETVNSPFSYAFCVMLAKEQSKTNGKK